MDDQIMMPTNIAVSFVFASLPAQPVLATGLPGGLVEGLIVLLFGPFIVAAVLLLAAAILASWRKRGAKICLLLAILSCVIGCGTWCGVLWKDWIDTKPARERNAKWAADVARDPTSLRSPGQDMSVNLGLLRNTTRLERLDLDASSVESSDLAYLRGLNHLQTLSLQGNLMISDAGIEHLKQLTNLRHLYLAYTGITEHGAEELQQALPHCKIYLTIDHNVPFKEE
jgi:hypothetical protein